MLQTKSNKKHLHLSAGNAPQQGGGFSTGQFVYTGWSGFKQLKNGDPPLVIAYSSPLKVKLTPEVRLKRVPAVFLQAIKQHDLLKALCTIKD